MPLHSYKQMKKSILIQIVFLFIFCHVPYATVHAKPEAPANFSQGDGTSSSSICTGDMYYISKGGNDNATGLTPATAWATVSKVNRSSFSPGDCILFKRGDTWNEQLVVPSSGTATAYITFGAYGSGNKPVFDGSGVSLAKYGGLIHSQKRSYIIIENLRVQDVGYVTPGGDPAAGNENTGINFAVGTNHGTVRNCEVYRTEAGGIRAHGANNIVIDSNEVELACIRSKSECITISDGSHDIEVMYNKVHNNGNVGIGRGGSGIDMKESSYNGKIHHNEVYNIHGQNGIYADAWDKFTTNIKIYNNYIHDFTDGGTGIMISSEQGGTLENVLVHHNIVKNVRTGISHHPGRFGQVDPIQNLYIYNNTIANCGLEKPSYQGGYLIRNPDANNVYIKNNIFSQNVGYQIGFSTEDMSVSDRNGYNIDKNVVYGTINTSSVKSVDGVAGSNAILADPLFVGTNDFRLRTGSPARNACDNSVWQGIQNIKDYDGVPITDGNGNIVAPGGRVSCGAYE